MTYTIVDEGYEVRVATSIRQVANIVTGPGHSLAQDNIDAEWIAVTERNISKMLKNGYFYVMADDEEEWIYRVQRH